MDIAAYLERIRYDGPRTPTLETLRALHRRHMLTIPFENLDIHLGRTIVLDETALFDKIVRQRRGGFCYELNGLFAALLRELRYDVTLLSGRVSNDKGHFGPEFDHLTLLVRIDGEPWMADVGFGDSFLEPIALNGKEQSSGGMLYFIDRWPEGQILLRMEDGLWSAKYVFSMEPHRLEEFAGMCVYHQSSPNSTFPRARICSRATPQGRVTLSEMRLVQTANRERTERMLESEEQYLQALAEHFDIELPNLAWKPLRQW